jgi:protein phosphatase
MTVANRCRPGTLPDIVLEIVCATDTGQVRTHNEDFVACDTEISAAVLADGMGGYRAGEVASRTAVEEILAYLRTVWPPQPPDRCSAGDCLRDAVLTANRAIFRQAQSAPEFHGMGTTVVAVLFHEHTVTAAHAGDSRLYRLRRGKLIQLTVDHSVLQELVDRGFFTPEEARLSPNKNLVTRALGVSDDIETDICDIPLIRDDIYLLCSDGLNDMLEDTLIRDLLLRHNRDLHTAARALIHAANAKGGEDNISVILARGTPTGKQPGGWWSRLTERFRR